MWRYSHVSKHKDIFCVSYSSNRPELLPSISRLIFISTSLPSVSSSSWDLELEGTVELHSSRCELFSNFITCFNCALKLLQFMFSVISIQVFSSITSSSGLLFLNWVPTVFLSFLVHNSNLDALFLLLELWRPLHHLSVSTLLWSMRTRQLSS